MVKKRCTRCSNESYSSSAEGTWKCPTCGEDLTEVKEVPAGKDD